ncbi:MAG TPA: 50S ribosomal protein L25 [Candidatus Omnitrophota bacterium]|nr:50S ribosomal protein L25 [Candidatus Omnitrophota bacterium]HPD84311.1 50S ribosomal protein L25 [Candidatus Omnitrophota bacterium]HRZ03168.1 50S ribosomal protein L25 [Candidatus Omnitrophota bacterium]
MEEIKLDVQVREKVGSRKIKSVRRENLIPAVIYGGKDKSTPIQVGRKEFEKIERAHRGANIIFRINVIKDEKTVKDYPAIVKEIQHDPVSDKIKHIDFHHISLTEEIEVKVPIAAKGDPVGVKQDGGSLDHLLWEIEVSCLPTKIPQKIEIDVSNLKIHDSIYVKDLPLPEGVKTKHDLNAIVFTVVPPMKEITPEAAAEAAAAPTEPEVIREKKEEAAKPGEAGEKPEAKKPEAKKAEPKEKEGK